MDFLVIGMRAGDSWRVGNAGANGIITFTLTMQYNYGTSNYVRFHGLR